MTRLKLERLQRGWTQTKLAALSSLAASDISKIEAGVLRPYARQLVRLAAALGIDAATLLDDIDLTCLGHTGEAGASPPRGVATPYESSATRARRTTERRHADSTARQTQRERRARRLAGSVN